MQCIGWCPLVTVTSGVDLAWYRSHLEDGISPASAFMGRPSLIVIISSASTIKPFYPHILWANKHFLPVIKRLGSPFCRCIIMEMHIAPHNGQWTWNLLFTFTGTWHLRPQDAIFVIGFVISTVGGQQCWRLLAMAYLSHLVNCIDFLIYRPLSTQPTRPEHSGKRLGQFGE